MGINIQEKLQSFYDNYIMRDFYGYFTPGAIILGYIFIVNGYYKLLDNMNVIDEAWEIAIVILIFYLLSYLLGHILTTISYYIIYDYFFDNSIKKYFADKTSMNQETKEAILKYMSTHLLCRKSIIKDYKELKIEDFELIHENVIDGMYDDPTLRLKYLRSNSLLILVRNLSVSFIILAILIIINCFSGVHDFTLGQAMFYVVVLLSFSFFNGFRSCKFREFLARDICVYCLREIKKEKYDKEIKHGDSKI